MENPVKYKYTVNPMKATASSVFAMWNEGEAVENRHLPHNDLALKEHKYELFDTNRQLEFNIND